MGRIGREEGGGTFRDLGGGVKDSRLVALVLVQVQQVRLEVGTRHLQSRAPLTTENALQEVPISQGQHALHGEVPPAQP